MMRMSAALFDRRITIVRPNAQKGLYGEPVANTTNILVNVPAHKRDITAKEMQKAGTDRVEISDVFIIRWTNLVSVRDLVTYDGDTYEITGLQEINRRCELKILVRRFDAGQI